jgi:hypothetical protein
MYWPDSMYVAPVPILQECLVFSSSSGRLAVTDVAHYVLRFKYWLHRPFWSLGGLTICFVLVFEFVTLVRSN